MKYDLELDQFACYKMEFLHNQAKENFESTEKWIYLGSNARDSGFAKVGMTMGDLTTRSSSPDNPSYYLFCAFKCKHNITKSAPKDLETDVLSYLKRVFVYPDGSSKRAMHHDSELLSECFDDVDFHDFFRKLHFYIQENHSNLFTISEFADEYYIDKGDFIDCEFNSRMSQDEINCYTKCSLVTPLGMVYITQTQA